MRYKNLQLSVVLSLFLTSCAGTGDQFAEGLRVITGKGGTKEQVNTFPDLKKQAAEIARTYPRPRWQKIYRADAADIFELLPGKRLLLGEVHVSSAIAEPEYGDLSLYDLKKGKKLWTVKRRDLEWGRYDVLTAKPRLILQGSSPKGGYYHALNIKTGKTIWEYDFKASERSVYDGANKRIYLLDVGDKKSTLRAVDTRNGKVLWKKALSGITDKTRIELQLTKSSLYVLADKIYRVKTANGTIKWQKPIPKVIDDWKTLQLRSTAHGVLVWDRRHMALLSSKNGKLRWGPVFTATPPDTLPRDWIDNMSIPHRGEGIYLFSHLGYVYRYDLQSGKRRWKFSPHKDDGITLTGPLLLTAGKLYVTTYKSFTTLNAKTGKRLARFEFPFMEGGLTDALSPDIIIERGNKIILAREGGAVYAFSKRTNKLLWKQVLNWKYLQYFKSRSINDDLYKVLPRKAYYEKKARDSAVWWGSWTSAVDFQWRGYQHPGTSGAQLDSFGSSMVLFQSMLGLSESIEKGLKQAALEGLAERLTMELTNAGKNHLRSIQHGYFIRPFDSYNGALVMLVQLDSGKRYDLIYSPSNIGMRHIDMRLPAFIIDPAGKSLYTTEIGTDTSKYEKYVKFKYGMPYPSILRYRLKDMKFKREHKSGPFDPFNLKLKPLKVK